MYSQKAQHILIDVKFKKYPNRLEDVDYWKDLGNEALKKGNYSLLKKHFHSFKPVGLSGFWLLSESHLSVHTWPEVNHVFVDLFSCGPKENTKKVVDHLIKDFERLGGEICVCKQVERGFVYSSKKDKDGE